MLTILALILITGIVFSFFEIDARLKNLAFIVIAIFVIIWLLQVFGITTGANLPQLR
jgi:hypothetical protein